MERPSEEVEESLSIPLTELTESSIGLVMSVSISSGPVPG
jgi:hypothetical protein